MRWISVELELENYNLSVHELKEIRQTLYDKYNSNIDHLKIKPDMSLVNGGIEVTGSFNDNTIPYWINMLRYFENNRYYISGRTGLHIHIDMRDIFDKLKNDSNELKALKRILITIKHFQWKRKYNLWRHINAFHNIYPKSVIDNIVQNSNSVEELSKILLEELRGKKCNDVYKELLSKGLEHDMWIEITPILRYLLNIDTDNVGKNKRKRTKGSFEYRGKLLLNGEDNRFVYYRSFKVDIFKEAFSELMGLHKNLIRESKILDLI